MSNTSCITRTEGQTKITSFTWNLPDFLQILENKIRDIRTDHNYTQEKIQFQTKIHLHGIENDLIEIYYMSSNSVFLKSSLTICLKRFEERTIATQEYHTIQGNKWQYLAKLYKKDLTTTEYDSIYILNDGSLRLKFQFMVTNNIKIDKSQTPTSQLSSDFENLLNNGLFSDITMKSVDGDEFKVHRAVLASRSMVLKAHFEHNTKECFTNIVESPLDTEVLKEVLTFIYSDKAPKVDAMPEKLLAAADFYQLSSLKALCEEALRNRLTVDNAIETLELADLHSADALHTLTLDYIKDGQAKLIIKTEGWARVKSVELIKTIYEYVMADDYDVDMK